LWSLDKLERQVNKNEASYYVHWLLCYMILWCGWYLWWVMMS